MRTQRKSILRRGGRAWRELILCFSLTLTLIVEAIAVVAVWTLDSNSLLIQLKKSSSVNLSVLSIDISYSPNKEIRIF